MHLVYESAAPSVPAPIDNTAYLFEWRRSFNEPVNVSLAHTNALARLTWTVWTLNRSAIVRSGQRLLSPDEWLTVQSLVGEADFWHLPPTDDTLPRLLRLDGATWAITAQADGRVYSVTRWSPAPNGPDSLFRRLALHLVGLTGIPLDSAAVY